jgi:hypothetical protein
MSVPVDLAALAEQVAAFPGPPYLMTANGDPGHVVSVAAELERGRFRLPAGRTTRANASAQPTVTLLWAPAPGGPYSLIVDGQATVDDDTETVEVVPTRAVLHRMAGVDPELPTCREVG